MLSTKEEIQLDVKQFCHSKEDVVTFAKGWLKYVNASKAKKQELQRVIEEIKWILEAAEELPDAFERFIQLKNVSITSRKANENTNEENTDGPR